MCCLFGLIDTELRFTGKEKSKMLHVLASASEERGTDATGVAYDSGRNLHFYKKPIPGHKLNFYIRDDSRFAMGHTRMTTQGSARKNYNNHPFRGITQTGTFALAHNGVLDNDISLRKSLHLPSTRIETDSYIAVQLIVQKGILSFDSLRYMAELLEGSFTITVLGDGGSLYIVKGDNPKTNKSRPVTRAAEGGEVMRFQNGTWSCGGKSFSTLHEALLSVWPK